MMSPPVKFVKPPYLEELRLYVQSLTTPEAVSADLGRLQACSSRKHAPCLCIIDPPAQTDAGCRGAGYFEGPGNFTMAYGTFNGYGFINGTSGSYTGALPSMTKLRSWP